LPSDSDEISLSADHWRSKVEELRSANNVLNARLSELKSANEVLSREKQELEQGHSEWLVRWNRDLWLTTGQQYEHSEFEFIDPLYEHMELEKEVSAVFLMPIVQRLARVRQLSFSYLLHPMAQHSRLAHSLGVSRTLELAMEKMIQRNDLYSSRGRGDFSSRLCTAGMPPRDMIKVCKLLGLLHDIGHGPFGHALDRYIGFRLGVDIKSVDKRFSVEYVKKHVAEQIKKQRMDPDLIARILENDKLTLKSYECLLAGLVDSALDADRLDFLVRDAYATGLQLGFINPRLIIDAMVPFEDDRGNLFLAFREPALDYLEHVLYARAIMYARCYEQDIKAAAEGMLVLAVKEFLPDKVDETVLRDIMLLDDELFLNLLMNGSSQKSSNVAKLLKLGRVYEKVYRVHKRQSKRVRDYIGEMATAKESTSVSQFVIPDQIWTRQIADGAGIRYEDYGWQVLVLPPSPNVYRELDVAIYILQEENGRFTTRLAPEMSPTLEETQKRIQESRQFVNVFIHPDLSKEVRERIRKSADQYFEPK
jgi:HD superfamily phosphohydrolase